MMVLAVLNVLHFPLATTSRESPTPSGADEPSDARVEANAATVTVSTSVTRRDSAAV